jgi:hypothetical protein
MKETSAPAEVVLFRFIVFHHIGASQAHLQMAKAAKSFLLTEGNPACCTNGLKPCLVGLKGNLTAREMMEQSFEQYERLV